MVQAHSNIALHSSLKGSLRSHGITRASVIHVQWDDAEVEVDLLDLEPKNLDSQEVCRSDPEAVNLLLHDSETLKDDQQLPTHCTPPAVGNV